MLLSFAFVWLSLPQDKHEISTTNTSRRKEKDATATAIAGTAATATTATTTTTNSKNKNNNNHHHHHRNHNNTDMFLALCIWRKRVFGLSKTLGRPEVFTMQFGQLWDFADGGAETSSGSLKTGWLRFGFSGGSAWGSGSTSVSLGFLWFLLVSFLVCLALWSFLALQITRWNGGSQRTKDGDIAPWLGSDGAVRQALKHFKAEKLTWLEQNGIKHVEGISRDLTQVVNACHRTRTYQQAGNLCQSL